MTKEEELQKQVEDLTETNKFLQDRVDQMAQVFATYYESSLSSIFESLNLPAKTSIAETLEKINKLTCDKVRIRQHVMDIEKLVEEEINRGYILSYEPGAGEAWRRRWREVLQKIDSIKRYIKIPV